MNATRFYNGDVPFLVVNDLEFLEYVFVRNFRNFVDRGLTMLTDQMHPILGKSILHAKGNDWKGIRSSVNYGLSAAKIKMMMPEVCKSADLFLERMEKLANEEVHLYDEYQLLSMDYTARGAFGIDTVFQLEPHHPLLTIAKGVLDGVMTGPLHMIAQCTSALGDIMKPFYWLVASFGEFTFKTLGEETSKIVELRRKDPSLRRPDMLQNLIDATMPTEDECGAVNEEYRTDDPAAGDDAFKTLPLSLPCFDTTGTALSYVTFFIAKHHEVQERVRQEVRDALADDQKTSVDYEIVTRKLKYLQQVIDESLRLLPPALIFTTRRAKEDFEYNGLRFKAGTCVMSPTYQVHTDSRYWPDPLMFDPERFSTENEAAIPKMAHQPFGLGPRRCVGMRMALTNIKYTLARILVKFQLELGEKQEASRRERSGKAIHGYPLPCRPPAAEQRDRLVRFAVDECVVVVFVDVVRQLTASVAAMLSLVGALTLIGVFLLAIFRWRQRHFAYFKTLGIPGPEPSLLWGNIREYHETHHFKVLDKWLAKYGDTFGFYDGDVPFIVTKDLDLLEYILVRNFQNFTDRGRGLVMEQRHPLLGNAVVYAEGTKWRNIRRSLAPGFTPAMLKQMITSLKNGADIFLEIVGEHADSGREVNVYPLYQRLTMDYVGRAAFGVDCSFQRGPEHALAATAKVVLRESTSTLGALVKPLYWINMLLGSYVAIAMTKETRKVIDLRRKNPELRRPDVLQNLLDAEYLEDSSESGNGTSENGKGPAKVSKRRVLTTDEVLVSACALFIAGYDTTSTSLSYITFLLAKHQDVQDRVRKEASYALSSNEDLDYETITRKLPYLSQVVNEALRLYPPVLTFISRRACKDFEYNGVHYKAGTCFMSPTLQIHRDARYWPDPLAFNPDRFSPENEGSFPKVAHQPFGVGPRNCIGMRMAYMSLNSTIARLVQRFELELGPSQGEGTLDIVSCAVVSKPAIGPWIVFRRL
ncbi:hypothetical protein HPB49_017500 [Dermacentor silvarum]|uniref:Uncharacterized protein n=1 Tax=Dermacentor silvarum TaxID=543639 RepID=A0ACB8CYU2_DERSI|nr:hypothetical protein HPB49_017500 [Dermacentor silvarum]